MRYTRLSEPVEEPVALAQLRAFLRMDADEESELMMACVSVARQMVEDYTGRSLGSPSTWLLTTSGFGDDELVLERSPTISVTSVKYWPDGDGAQITMTAGTDYRVITTLYPAVVQLLADAPALADRADAVTVEFSAGYQASPTMPPTLRHCVLILAAHLFENRLPLTSGTSMNEIPLHLKHMLDSQRIGGFVG